MTDVQGEPMKLTANAVRAASLPAGKTEAIFFDDDVPGFGLRLRAQGSRTFVFQYKCGTKQRRMALGVASALTITDARKTAGTLYARVRLGQDPAADKAEAHRQASETFKSCLDQYLDALRKRYRPRSFKEIERHLTKHAKALHDMPLANISRRDVAAVIVALTNAAGGPTANRVRSSLSAFFTWSMQRGLAENNPVIGTEKNEEKSRDRVLTPAELRLIWNALEDDEYGSVIKLLALTGQRANEIGGLRWGEIHDGQIILPAERTKNGKPHVLPLSEPAVAIIAQQTKGGDFIFGNAGRGFTNWTRGKERLDQRVATANGGEPIPHWTPHDLRRSLATYAGGGLPEHLLKKIPAQDRDCAGGLGIEPHAIEAVLNHYSGGKAGVAGIYNRSTYAREKKVLLDLWADRLMAIVEGRTSNVVNIQKR
jgi:integrase